MSRRVCARAAHGRAAALRVARGDTATLAVGAHGQRAAPGRHAATRRHGARRDRRHLARRLSRATARAHSDTTTN